MWWSEEGAPWQELSRWCSTGLEIAAIVGIALSAAGTGYALANQPKPPAPPPATPHAPPPPPPPPVPPPPTVAEPDTGVSDARARLKRRRGIESTIYTSPLGITSPSQTLGG